MIVIGPNIEPIIPLKNIEEKNAMALEYSNAPLFIFATMSYMAAEIPITAQIAARTTKKSCMATSIFRMFTSHKQNCLREAFILNCPCETIIFCWNYSSRIKAIQNIWRNYEIFIKELWYPSALLKITSLCCLNILNQVQDDKKFYQRDFCIRIGVQSIRCNWSLSEKRI